MKTLNSMFPKPRVRRSLIDILETVQRREETLGPYIPESKKRHQGSPGRKTPTFYTQKLTSGHLLPL